MYAALFSALFLLVGLTIGWIVCEKYITFLQLTAEEPHIYEDLFESNPHPELFDAEGNIDKGEYLSINFPPDFDPETDTFFIEGPEDFLDGLEDM